MINKVLEKVIGTKDSREIKKISKIVDKINDLESSFEELSEEELKGKTAHFRERISKGESLDSILPEAFATVREVSKRLLGLRHFDVQLLGGIIMHQGKIAEMRTGEGKTLASTSPVYLNALAGSVHVVTVNDYLAKRDMEWMKPIYNFLGLKVGLVIGRFFEDKSKEYNSDIVYATNSELGFDFLRDNTSKHSETQKQKEHFFALVDEVDSLLIDEARTPLIISGPSDEMNDIYTKFSGIAKTLKEDDDYIVEKKDNNVLLTEEGITAVEKQLGIDNLYSIENIDMTHYLEKALKAKELFQKDKDYIVRDGKVLIVDEFTGRIMDGRRYSEGLHQSIEAKEGVEVAAENKTLASITLQNYFRMYKKLGGMTGTAKTDESEFVHTYGLSVVVIPTNRPVIRKDYNDIIYLSKSFKYRAIIEKIKEIHAKDQPILVGTASIESSEHLSMMLSREGVAHKVLNAKHHEKEAEIVAQAGKLGAVTIATNMAGRGTDIVLGGNAKFIVKNTLAKDDESYQEKRKAIFEQCSKEKEKVKSLGGLFILGSERHENRRIDNQLRGRAGRQGDPGESLFYISLEDDLMKIFGFDTMIGTMKYLGYKDEEPVNHKMATKSIEGAQKRVEARNFASRQQLLEYDDVVNKQREVIYNQRKDIMSFEEVELDEKIKSLVDKFVYDVKKMYTKDTLDRKNFYEYFEEILHLKLYDIEVNKISDEIFKILIDHLSKFEEPLKVKRKTMLKVIDGRWRDNLSNLEGLKEGIHLRSYGQRDPIAEYKISSYQIYKDMAKTIRREIVEYLIKLEAPTKEEPIVDVKEKKEEDE